MNHEQSRRNLRAVSAFHYFIPFLWLAAGVGSALILAQDAMPAEPESIPVDQRSQVSS